MNIHQLSVHHDERQDRLLLRLNTQDQQEFRFWLTRRMTLRLMPAIQQSAVRLEAAQPGVAATDGPAQQLLSELKRYAFLKNAEWRSVGIAGKVTETNPGAPTEPPRYAH